MKRPPARRISDHWRQYYANELVHAAGRFAYLAHMPPHTRTRVDFTDERLTLRRINHCVKQLNRRPARDDEKGR